MLVSEIIFQLKMVDYVEHKFLHSFISHCVITPPTTIQQVSHIAFHGCLSSYGYTKQPRPIRVITKKIRKQHLIYLEGGNCFCRVCHVKLESKYDLKYHTREESHLDNLLKIVKGEYRCTLCPDQVIGSESSIMSHLYGEEHVNNLIDNNNDAVKKFSKEINSQFCGTEYIKNLFIEMEAIRFNVALTNEYIVVEDCGDGKIIQKCTLCNEELPRDDSALRSHIKGRKHKIKKFENKNGMSMDHKYNLRKRS